MRPAAWCLAGLVAVGLARADEPAKKLHPFERVSLMVRARSLSAEAIRHADQGRYLHNHGDSDR